MPVPTKCTYCEGVFDSQNEAKRHERDCPKKWDFMDKENAELRKAMKNQTTPLTVKDVASIREESIERAHKCDVDDCKRSFDTMHGLLLHKAKTHGVYSEHPKAIESRKADAKHHEDKGIKVIPTEKPTMPLFIKPDVQVPKGAHSISVCQRCVIGYQFTKESISHCPKCGASLTPLAIKIITIGD